MALFSINRYTEGEDFVEDENREEANLIKLKEKIEERRKAKLKREIFKEPQQDYTVEIETEESSDVKPHKESITDTGENDSTVKNDAKSLNVPQFKVLGVKEFQKKPKVKRVLPNWLSHPTAISVDLKEPNVTIDELPFLHESLKKKLHNEGIERLFPVQALVVPWLLEEYKKGDFFWPRDICVSAPTGSGKTLSYVLPIIQVLVNRIDRQIRAMVVLPVKELAMQVAKVFKDFCIGTNLKVALIVGSVPLPQERSQLLRYTKTGGWQSEVDIMVCTAGRLVEHLQSTDGFSLRDLKFLVIDEADRIMQNIQNDWLYHLNRHVEFGKSITSGNAPPLNFKTMSTLRRPPQKLFFSATLSQDPEKLNEWGLFQPKLFSTVRGRRDCDSEIVEISKYTTPMELTENYVTCDIEQKPAILHILLKSGCRRVLCFTNSAQSAHRLTILLRQMVQDDLRVAEMSAALNRNARESVLKKFQTGIVNVLISTDALARGIDITDCDNVISYDPPKNIKTYIHRVGRTGRAGRAGTASAILVHSQVKSFKEILKTAGKSNIEEINIDEAELGKSLEIYENAMVSSKEQIDKESDNRIDRVKAAKRGRSMNVGHKKRQKTK